MLSSALGSFSLLTIREKLIFVSLVFARSLVQLLDLIGLFGVGLIAGALASPNFESGNNMLAAFGLEITGTADLIVATIWVTSLFIVKSSAAALLLGFTTRFLAGVEARAAVELTRFIFSGGLKRLRETSIGESQWIIAQSSHIAFSSMLFTSSAIVTETVLLGAIFVAFLVVDFESAILITLYFALILGIFQVLVNKRLRKLGQQLSENGVGVNDGIMNFHYSYREIAVSQKIDYFVGKVSENRTPYAFARAKQRLIMGLPRFLVEVALMLGFLALVLWQVYRGATSDSLSTTAVFLAGGLRMMAALLPLQNALAEIRTNAPLASKAQELIVKARTFLNQAASKRSKDKKPEIVEPLPPVGVTLERVSFSYESKRNTIDDVSLEIAPGELVAFIGPSGSGKTTLVDLIVGLLERVSGSIEFSSTQKFPDDKTSPPIIGYVPQTPGIVAGSVLSNVALGIRESDIDRRRVEEVLALTGLSNTVADLPQGIETLLRPGDAQLSGGQVQRLGLARALYREPQLLVLDEATSALDAESELAISSIVRRLRGRTTVVIIAHRLSTIQDADNIFVLSEGAILANGTFSKVREEVPFVEKYAELLNLDP